MIVILIFLGIFIISLGGIFFIIKDKMPLVANLDVSQIPEEKIAQTKKNLLDKKVNRQLIELTARFKTQLDIFRTKTKYIFSKTRGKTLDPVEKFWLKFFRRKNSRISRGDK